MCFFVWRVGWQKKLLPIFILTVIFLRCRWIHSKKNSFSFSAQYFLSKAMSRKNKKNYELLLLCCRSFFQATTLFSEKDSENNNWAAKNSPLAQFNRKRICRFFFRKKAHWERKEEYACLYCIYVMKSTRVWTPWILYFIPKFLLFCVPTQKHYKAFFVNTLYSFSFLF